MLQSQIFDDLTAPEGSKVLHPEFNDPPNVPPEIGGYQDTSQLHDHTKESMNDEELQTHLIAGRVPTIDEIYRYTALCCMM